MPKVSLISEKYIKENSTIDDNLDVTLITPFIDIAQIELKKIIGKELMEELMQQVRDNNLTALNKELLDYYIQPFLLWSTLKEANPYLMYKYRNKGIMVKNAEFAQPVSKYEVESLTKKANDKANLYAYELDDYLRENSESYPLYKCVRRPIGSYNMNLTDNRRREIYAKRYRK